MKIKTLILVLIITLICIIIGLNSYRACRRHGNKIQYSDKYFKNINGNFITMTEEQKNLIRRNIKNIKKGMPMDEIKMNLGEPTYIRRKGTKEGKFTGWRMAYYFVKQYEDSVKTSDQYLDIYINTDSKAENISTSIKELRMKNWGTEFYIRSLEEYEAGTK